MRMSITLSLWTIFVKDDRSTGQVVFSSSSLVWIRNCMSSYRSNNEVVHKSKPIKDLAACHTNICTVEFSVLTSVIM